MSYRLSYTIKMLFNNNMDAELQHLISISMDKMTSGTNSTAGGRGSRKSRGMDLRKALLVAHFLQDVRCAYIDEDYEIVANTIRCLKPDNCEDKISETTESNKQEINKEVDERCSEESRTYFMDTDSEIPLLPSSSIYQSCVTNSGLMVSRISQVTQPLAISVNTNFVMSHQSETNSTDTKEEKEESCIDEDVPAFCEELEVSCEEYNSVIDDVTSENQEVTSQKQEFLVNNSGAAKGCESHTEVTVTLQKIPHVREELVVDTVESAHPVKRVTCPLPKKKRPLPKEFWDSDSQTPASKLPRIKTETNQCDSSKVVSNQLITHTFTTSIANTVTLESKTSTSLSTVCSVMGSAPSSMSQKADKTNPKVVVQITQSCDSFLPITCSQINLEKRLSEMTVRTF